MPPGLEQAAGIEAEVVGKPAAAFPAAALAHLGASAAHTLMVGDGIETDVLAAQRQGLTGVLVKTGKYLPATRHGASGTPGHVLGSFADLPALLKHPGVTAPPRTCAKEPAATTRTSSRIEGIDRRIVMCGVG